MLHVRERRSVDVTIRLYVRSTEVCMYLHALYILNFIYDVNDVHTILNPFLPDAFSMGCHV